MRPHVALASITLLFLLVSSVAPLYAQDTEVVERVVIVSESQTFTLSGGWSWPMGGPVKEYKSGPTLAASFRTAYAGTYMGGLEVGYSWFDLDTAKLDQQNPGSTYNGGTMGILSITTENDYLFGLPSNPFRPFLNLGLGFYRSFIDDATVTTGSTTEPYNSGVYKGSFFGFHAGLGALINRDRFGLRLDANYVHLFSGGPDPEFFTARVGFVFYLSDPNG